MHINSSIVQHAYTSIVNEVRVDNLFISNIESCIISIYRKNTESNSPIPHERAGSPSRRNKLRAMDSELELDEVSYHYKGLCTQVLLTSVRGTVPRCYLPLLGALYPVVTYLC